MGKNIIFDVHNHLGVSPDGGESSLESILENIKKYRIGRLVLFAIDEEDSGQTFEKVNDRVIQAQKKYPDKIIGFVRIVPSAGEAALLELNRCLEAGVRGIKMKALDGYPVTETFSVLDCIKGIPDFIVIVHTDHRPGSTPFDWQPVIEKYPDIYFVLAHGGKDRYRDCADVVNRYPNTYVETSTLSYNRTKYIYRHVDVDRILFASDYPYSHPAIEMAKYEVLVQKEEDLQKIFFLNACRLFDLEPRSLL